MTEQGRTRLGSGVTPAALAVLAFGLLVLGIALALLAAEQFRGTISDGTSTCVTTDSHSAAIPGAGTAAIVVQVFGVICAVVAGFVEIRVRAKTARPILLVAACSAAGTGLVAVLVDIYVIHQIGVCAALLSS